MSGEERLERARRLGDAELAEFRARVCLTPGHIGTCAIRRCRCCGGMTPSSSMAICSPCADEQGVRAYDLRWTSWGSRCAAEAEATAVAWLALQMRGHSAEREAALRALRSFLHPGLAEAFELVRQGRGDTRRAHRASVCVVGFRGSVPEGVVPEAAFLGGTVVRVNSQLRYAVVRTQDAVDFEARVASGTDVAFLEWDME